ncbi:MAG: hypothetical protein HRT66_12275 [Flavobacteriaceae bacterium]|nr:hypothetical protein [Flavobacteriaceae bacterium]
MKPIFNLNITSCIQWGFLLSLVLLQEYYLGEFSLIVTMFNPIDLSRILLLLQLDIAALLGYTGAVFQKFFGTSMGMITSIAMLSVWVVLPVLSIPGRARKKDF